MIALCRGRAGAFAAWTWAALLALSGALHAETHWEIQAVDASGRPAHPKVNADPFHPAARVVLEGIALHAPGELADTACEFLLVVQGEGKDHAGTQAFAACFFQPDLWPDAYGAAFGVVPGDRVRLSGFVAGFIGKTNMNERHTADPALNFTVEVLGHPGLPEPELVPSVGDANFFDETRLSGGEWYQSRWVRLNGVRIIDGTWAAGSQVTIADGTGTLGMKLSSTGDFDDHSAPEGAFDVIGIFDQEPFPLNFAASPKENYRIWVKRYEHIIPRGPKLIAAASRKTHGEAGPFDIPLALSGAPGVECRAGGPTEIVLTFSTPVEADDGLLDASEVSLSAGRFQGIWTDDRQVIIALDGVHDGACLMLSLAGLVDAEGNPLVGDGRVGAIALHGDVNGDAIVASADITRVKARSGQGAAADTFRCDVNVDNIVASADITQVKSRSGREAGCD